MLAAAAPGQSAGRWGRPAAAGNRPGPAALSGAGRGSLGDRSRLTLEAVVRAEPAPPDAPEMPPSAIPSVTIPSVTRGSAPSSTARLPADPDGPLATMAMALISVALLSVLRATSSASISISELTASWARRVVGSQGRACRQAAKAHNRRWWRWLRWAFSWMSTARSSAGSRAAIRPSLSTVTDRAPPGRQ